jgi:heat shock protein HslJ
VTVEPDEEFRAAILRLDGRTFDVVMLRMGDALASLPEGVHMDARFAEGRVSGSSGCNRYTAECTTEAGTIRIGPAASTMMACPPPRMEVERAFLAALDAARTYVGAGPVLAFLDGDGSVVVELFAAPADVYVGSWAATGINNGREAVVSPEAGSVVTLELAADGNVSGAATCNRFRGTYAVDEETISFMALATTRMACPSEALAAQEAAYLAALAAAVTWDVSGDRLDLRDARGAMQATFRRT